MEILSDEELLALPAPTCLILCRIFNPAGNVLGARGEGYSKCERCPEHIPCVRYIEAELRTGLGWRNIARAYFSKEEEEKQMERYLHSVGYTRKEKK